MNMTTMTVITFIIYKGRRVIAIIKYITAIKEKQVENKLVTESSNNIQVLASNEAKRLVSFMIKQKFNDFYDFKDMDDEFIVLYVNVVNEFKKLIAAIMTQRLKNQSNGF